MIGYLKIIFCAKLFMTALDVIASNLAQLSTLFTAAHAKHYCIEVIASALLSTQVTTSSQKTMAFMVE